LTLLSALSGCGDNYSGTSGPGIGQPIPQLSLKPLTGDSKPIELSSLAGRVVLIDFWGTWCPPCAEELPHVAAIAAKYDGRADFLCLPVSCGGGAEKHDDLRDETIAFLQGYKLDLATYWDPGTYTRFGVEMAAGFSGYPTTIVLDRHGIIRGLWVGYRRGDERQIERCVAEQLDKPEPPAGRAQDGRPQDDDRHDRPARDDSTHSVK
jgi:thiol-disulfide isomerase/thioredoxin